MNNNLKKALGCEVSEAAIKEIIELCDLENKSEEELTETIERGELTCNTARNGRNVLWYVNGSTERCIYTDTLEELSNAEIEKELL